jgi:hypothetical protein
MRIRLSPWALLLVAGSASALPNPDSRFRPGANHHLGDDSFVAANGRAPADDHGEKVRMKLHLQHVRALLASQPATRPDLAARRAELLGYLDDYIAKGITPRNTTLPWRTAVFIDDDNAICAVGYLIERSTGGRALPEKIAAAHRYDFLEDIAAAMPEVDAWIRASGFTLDELASIQPAYSSPNVEQWRTWDLVKHAPPDGPFSQEKGRHITVAGTFLKKTLHGTWKVTSEEGNVIGTGTLDRGNGTWRSYYADGKARLAEGPYVANVAHGPWTLYHASGNVAANGAFAHGMRVGAWTFYNDTPDKKLLATGSFDSHGSVAGTWQHYDAAGKPLAKTWTQSGNFIDVVPNADGVAHLIHQWTYNGSGRGEWYEQQLERFSLGGDHIYVHTSDFRREPSATEATGSGEPLSVVYDTTGHRLVRGATSWTSADCHWSTKRIGVAKAGETAWLHEMLYNDIVGKAVTVRKESSYSYKDVHPTTDAPACDAPVAVAAARGAMLDKLIAPREAKRAAAPTFVRELVLGETGSTNLEELEEPKPGEIEDQWQRANRLKATDLRRLLTAYTVRYVEWPHIDGRFAQLFETMAGRMWWEWAGGEPEADGSDPRENERIARERAARGAK